METLTEAERAFLERLERNKKKHNQAQKQYREKNKEIIKEYNDTYQANLKQQRAEIRQKLLKADAPPAKIDIKEYTQPPKIDRRTRKGKKQAETQEIKPSYETRQTPLEYSSIEDYLRKSNILHKLFKGQELSPQVKAELKKLLNDNPAINEGLILDEMDYIKDVEGTSNKIRSKYPNDNTFKSYINILSVITSHIKSINNIHQIYSKIGKETNLKVQEVRAENEINEGDEGKIIEIGLDEFIKNVEKLDKIDDILIYALYLLFPARRLDYRNMRITNETDETRLNEINYLIIDKTNITFVFNDYKTKNTYNKQIFKVPDELRDIINRYINIKGLKNGDFLIHLDKDKKEIISQGNYSAKISNVFKKVYGVPASVRYLRMSWVSNLYAKNPTAKQIKELAFKMGHSITEAILYNKIFRQE